MADSKNFRSLPTAIETDNNAVFEVVEKSILGLWEVVNNLTALRPPKRARYRVTIFGSARMEPDSDLYEVVKQLAGELTLMGCDIVTGGGPGLMQAANEGSVLADPDDQVKSIGIRVDLKQEQEPNPFVEEAYCHRTFFSRLHHFVLMSDAFIVMPGGIGTTLEALMIWQLLQVRKLDQTPFILVGTMWQGLMDWAETHMLDGKTPMIDPADITIPHCVNRYEDAIAILKTSHHHWQQLKAKA
ncbi:LOG family protein [Leptothoe spongobia]|uniref:LOG family protein n=1 Tax=Leptothoe spongobia TAU-MAC 1115 TaxID=1967444 RepID=A0A947DF54_9CYAN|nr:LOG family protein [Leptothoe spongobia]MBT9315902.1 LOG family protein [Leptothoe spongobia TAU-MAC 1115]